MKRLLPPVSALALLAGCATAPPTPVAVVPPAPPVAPPAPMPAGGYPAMVIPAAFADGSYPTPNRALSGAAAIWHLRAGLNVAALACRGPDEALVVARYNALIARHKVALKTAEATLAAEYRLGGGAEWRARYDQSMTSLYNFFSQSFARAAFCASATAILAETETVDDAALGGLAARSLPLLDRAFTDFYRAFDMWRGTRPAAPVTIAATMIAVPPPVAGPPIPRVSVAPSRAAVTPPRIELDIAALDTTVVVRAATKGASLVVAAPERLAVNR